MKAADANPREIIMSMLVDRRAGKPLEIDYLSDALVRMGERLC
jgi:ketopantoate reductase